MGERGRRESGEWRWRQCHGEHAGERGHRANHVERRDRKQIRTALTERNKGMGEEFGFAKFSAKFTIGKERIPEVDFGLFFNVFRFFVRARGQYYHY